MKKVSKVFTVFAIVDAEENTWIDVVKELTQEVVIVRLTNQFGRNCGYLGSAEELPTWCVENGLRLSVTKQEITATIEV